MTKKKPDEHLKTASDTPVEWLTQSKKKKLPLSVTVSCAVVVFFLVMGTGIYYYVQYQHTKALLSNPSLSSANAAQVLISKIGQLMELPSNEVPQIATITDITKLDNQPFFKNAQNGDKVLIYTKDQEAIIYDPSINKIVTVGPISIRQQPQQEVAGAAITPKPTLGPVSVAIYNGTLIAGLAKTIQKELSSEMSNVTVVQTGNATKSTYQQTLVVNMSPSSLSNAQAIATLLHAQLSSLPAGETPPTNADVLIILGKQ